MGIIENGLGNQRIGVGKGKFKHIGLQTYEIIGKFSKK